MQRLIIASRGLAHDVWIWKPARFAPAAEATVTARDQKGRFGFERAAEDPLRARE